MSTSYFLVSVPRLGRATVVSLMKLICVSVSGLLANQTGNSTYLDSASLTYQFMLTQLYSKDINATVDGIDAVTCALKRPGNIVDTAVFLEGTAILGAVSGNETIQSL